MDPVLAGLAGGAGGFGASLGLDLAGAAFSAKMSGDMAQAQRRWAEKMYDSRYVRTVRDMRAAGLNPILATRHGPGSPPGGAAGKAPDLSGVGSRATQAGLAASMRKAELGRITSTADLNNAARDKAIEDAGVASATQIGVRLENERKAAQIVREKEDAEFYKSELGQAARNWQLLMQAVGGESWLGNIISGMVGAGAIGLSNRGRGNSAKSMPMTAEEWSKQGKPKLERDIERSRRRRR